ncbi:MAG: AAA family ATPase [Polyangiales bacterium]
MKLSRLELTAFGPFTGKSLAFSERPLQLIYGPNEAGKSTTLRALTGLLYGIDPRTSDAYQHEMSKLRVGATLVDGGRSLAVTRRKGVKNTLLDSEGGALPEDALAPWLGGLDEKLFKQMFGLDHERLRQGAEALLRAGGQLGEVLFDASTGGRSVHLALEQLRAEADALYKARGRTPQLNAALEVLKDVKAERNKAVLLPQAYIEQQQGLEAARAERAEAANARAQNAREKARLTRLLALAPQLLKRDQLAEELRALGEPVDAGEAAVRVLEQRLAQLLAGERELPAARVTLAAHEREVEQLEARLGPSVAALHTLDTASKARLRKLVEQRAARVDEQAQLARRDAELAQELARVRQALDALPAAGATQLAELTADIEREDLPARLLRLEGELEKGRAQLARRLAPFGDARDALPGDDELAALELGFEQVAQERARLEREGAEQAAERARLERGRMELLARGALVSRAELEAVRQERDRALDALLAGGPAAPQLRAHAMLNERADGLADRMVDEAQRAAELATLELALTNLDGKRAELAQALAKLQQRDEQARERWRMLLAPWRLAEQSARQARAGVAELAKLRTLAEELDQQAAEHARALERAKLRASELAAMMQQQGPLEVLLRDARARVAGERERERQHVRLSEQHERLNAERNATTARAGVNARELDELEQRYHAELGTRGLDVALAPDELVACFEELTLLAQQRHAAETLRARERALEADRARLGADAGLEAGSLEASIEALARVARERVQAERDRVRLRAELAKLDEQVTQAAEGEPVAELRQALHLLDRDQARARLLELDELVEAASQRIADLDQKLGSLSAGLEQLDRDAGAAALAESYEQELAHARALARRYIETKLALGVLGREVERYRSEHQAPLLKRAGALFQRLTLHRYRGLKVEYDDGDQPVLACSLGGHTSVRMNGLSDGTRDQLYLALRVASIERYCQSRAAVPLILDDVLIHFDDLRAQAALEVLAELGQHTQVLFFTHHARMVELARAALPASALEVHELAPRAAVRSDGPLFDTPS